MATGNATPATIALMLLQDTIKTSMRLGRDPAQITSHHVAQYGSGGHRIVPDDTIRATIEKLSGVDAEIEDVDLRIAAYLIVRHFYLDRASIGQSPKELVKEIVTDRALQQQFTEDTLREFAQELLDPVLKRTRAA